VAEQFRLDTSLLRETAGTLRQVAREFDGANAASDAIAHALGHGDLAAKVHDFAHEWDDKRAGMVKAIGELATASEQIGTQIEGWDDTFAQVLRGGS